MADQYKVIYDPLIGAIFSDLEWSHNLDFQPSILWALHVVIKQQFFYIYC